MFSFDGSDLAFTVEADLENISDGGDDDEYETYFNGVDFKNGTLSLEQDKDDEWSAFLESSMVVNAHFDATFSSEQSMYHQKVTAELDSSKDTFFLQDHHLHFMSYGEVMHDIAPEVEELVAEMLEALERSARICEPRILERREIKMDLSLLPKEIVDEPIFDVSLQAHSSGKENIATSWASNIILDDFVFAIGTTGSVESVKSAENAELQRVLDEDRKQRQRRKEKREEEILKIKTNKAAICIQCCVRSRNARTMQRLKLLEFELKLQHEAEALQQTAAATQRIREDMETIAMDVAEGQSRLCWEYNRMLEEGNRLAQEDAQSHLLRVWVVATAEQQRVFAQSLIGMEAQDDIVTAIIKNVENQQVYQQRKNNIEADSQTTSFSTQILGGIEHRSNGVSAPSGAVSMDPKLVVPVGSTGVAGSGWGGVLRYPSVIHEHALRKGEGLAIVCHDGRGEGVAKHQALPSDRLIETIQILKEEEEYEFDDVEFDDAEFDDAEFADENCGDDDDDDDGRTEFNRKTTEATIESDFICGMSTAKGHMAEVPHSQILAQLYENHDMDLSVLASKWAVAVTGYPHEESTKQTYKLCQDSGLQAEKMLRCTANDVTDAGSRNELTGPGGQAEGGAVVAACRAWAEWWDRERSIMAKNEFSAIQASDPGTRITRILKEPPVEMSGQDEKDLQKFGLLGQELTSIGTLQLNVEGVRSSTFLRALSGLRKLELNVNHLRELGGLRDLTSLTDLSVKDNSLHTVEPLLHLHGLQCLKLDNNQLSDLQPLSGLSQLSFLTAKTNSLVALPCLHCPSLQRLDLYHNQISVAEPQSLRAVCSSLTHLDLGRNRLKDLSGAGLSCCQLLHTLVLSQNQLTSVPAPMYLPHLRSLWLSGNRLQNLRPWTPAIAVAAGIIQGTIESGSAHGPGPAEGSSHIDEISCTTQWPVFLPQLEKLFLQDNSIMNIEAGALSAMPQLAELDLSFNSIPDCEGLLGIALGASPTLRTLQLQDNPVHKELEPTAAEVRIREARAQTGGSNFVAKSWLLRACPGLTTLSGNSCEGIDRISSSSPLVGDSFYYGVKCGNDTAAVTCAHLMAGLRSSGRWGRFRASIGSAETAMGGRDINSSDLTEGFTLKTLAALELIRGHTKCRGGSPALSGIQKYAIARLQSHSETALSLANVISALRLDQSCLRVREKSERQPNVNRNWSACGPDPSTMRFKSATESSNYNIEEVELVETYWETAMVLQLRSHSQQLLNWAHASKADALALRTNSDPLLSAESLVKFYTTIPALQTKGRELLAAAALSVQRLFRGSRTRKQLRVALASARYHDDELDAVMGDELAELMGAAEFGFEDIEEFLKPASLRPDWDWRQRAVEEREVESNLDYEYDENHCGSVLSRAGSSMVYGDHRRSRRPSALSIEHPGSDWSVDGTGAAEAVHSPLSSQPHSALYSSVYQQCSRPGSAMTDISAASSSTPYGGTPSAVSCNEDTSGSCMVPSSARSAGQTRSEVVAEEWGIQDPKLLAAILKRNKRMKHFVDAKNVREKEKDPAVRYEKFVKASNRSGCVTKVSSGSFGGKPRTFRPAVGGGAARAVTVTPAWMFGSEDNPN